MRSSKLYIMALLVLGLLAVAFLGFSEFSEDESKQQPVLLDDDRHRGAHVFGIGDDTDLKPLEGANIEWLTLVPWGFQQDYLDKDIGHKSKDSTINAQYDEFWVRRIKHVRNSGYKVFVKPHVWVDTTLNGKWRSDIFPATDEDWQTWSASYRDFILRYAKNAEAGGAEMFCVGMELSRIAVEKPEFWRELIADVRKVYSGKITYGANWSSEYKQIEFWDKLDYIGVQAYFPLANEDCVTDEDIATGWNKYLPDLKAVSEQFDRKILFTEIGYKSTTKGAIRPWEWAENPESVGNDFSAEVQANAYSAFFDIVWEQVWMAGAYFWQLRIDYDGHESYALDFTPQGKAAMRVMLKGYKR